MVQVSQAVLAASLVAISVRQGAAQQAAAITGHTHSGQCGTALGDGNQEVTEDDHAVTTEVTTITTTGMQNYNTYQISLVLATEALNVYSIYGDQNRGLVFPPAYQVATPFGTDLGGVSPALVSVSPQAALDSWLSVGISTGDSAHKLASIGIAFSEWNEQNALLSAPNTGGSVFWMDPDEVRADCQKHVSRRICNQRFDAHLDARLSYARTDTVTAIAGHWLY